MMTMRCDSDGDNNTDYDDDDGADDNNDDDYGNDCILS